MKIYTCIPNGDFNMADTSLANSFGRVDFEMNSGQDWVLLSKKELTDEQYSKILDALSTQGEQKERAVDTPKKTFNLHKEIVDKDYGN